MKKDPTFEMTQFPAYITVRQKELLKEASKQMGVSISELLREAIHYWLKREGRDDGLLCDREELLQACVREFDDSAKRYALRIEKEMKEAKAKARAKEAAKS